MAWATLGRLNSVELHRFRTKFNLFMYDPTYAAALKPKTSWSTLLKHYTSRIPNWPPVFTYLTHPKIPSRVFLTTVMHFLSQKRRAPSP